MLVLRLAADRENSIRNFLSPPFPLSHVNKAFIHYTLTYTGHFSICIIFHSHWHWLINLIQAGFLILSTFFSPLYFVTLYIPLYIGKSHSNIWFLRFFSYIWHIDFLCTIYRNQSRFTTFWLWNTHNFLTKMLLYTRSLYNSHTSWQLPLFSLVFILI